MPIAPHLKTGKTAEQIACRWLQRQGLHLLQRNYRCRYGEIDLVMLEQHCLVVVEVRYRRHSQFGGAAASVTAKKRQRLLRSAAHLLAHQRAYQEYPLRFDVVALSGDLKAPSGNWIKNAFTADAVQYDAN